MKHILTLAWRHMTHYWGRSLILAASVTLTFVVPVAVELFVRLYGDSVTARAADTPLIAGAKGSRYDLVLTNLYFRGKVPRTLPMAEVDSLLDSGLATPIPLMAKHRARGYPIVGATPEYFEFRGLEAAAGTRPLRLGDAVLGARVAQDLGLGVGDKLLSDKPNSYDLTLGYPLRMSIVGVLSERGTPDDGAVFVDLKTAWVVDGLGHGHAEPEEQGEERVLHRSEQGVVLDSGIREYTEITDENIHTFHFHDDPGDLPLTGVVVVPRDDRAATILKGRYRVSSTSQLLVPQEVMAEILGFVFQLKALYDANVAFVSTATALFLALIMMLAVRVRHREIATLARLGCARSTIVWVFATELALTVLAGFVAAAALAAASVLIVAGGHGLL